MRISVVGPSGSGKTHTARQIATCLRIPHVELDALYWGPNWKVNRDFPDRVEDALENACDWVVDGNYRQVQDDVWSRADTVVWLDYSLPRTMWQIVKRTLRRFILQEKLWSGNQESLKSLFSRQSIILYAIKSHREIRSGCPDLLSKLDVEVVQLTSPHNTANWIATLTDCHSAKEE